MVIKRKKLEETEKRHIDREREKEQEGTLANWWQEINTGGRMGVGNIELLELSHQQLYNFI